MASSKTLKDVNIHIAAMDGDDAIVQVRKGGQLARCHVASGYGCSPLTSF